MLDQLRQVSGYTFYLVAISLVGLFLLVLGLLQAPFFTPRLHLALFLLLAAAAQVATTSSSVSDQAGITYTVGAAVAAAAIPFFGPLAAVLIVAVDNVSVWLIKRRNEQTWKKSGRQLAFNTGMHSIAIFVSGTLLLWLLDIPFLAHNLLGMFFAWLVVAVVYEEINLWLLIGILRLQLGPELNPWEVWREDRWASVIDILVTGIGGAVLAYALAEFGTSGLLVFFLPILLSAFAFQVYVRNMRAHMDNLESIVAERTQALETLNREKDAFLAVLTHDMKSPLNTIGLTADLLHEKPQILIKRPRLMEIILSSQQTLVDMVSNILDLEKLEAKGSIPLNKKELILQDVIQAAVEATTIQAENKQIALQFLPWETPVSVRGDEQQLLRVLANLLSNSIKYSREQGTVEVVLQANGERATIHVQDSGYGIPADELPYIFDRFRRVKKHEQLSAGTGLGLAISKAIVEAHDGQIVATSEEGAGSCFSVTLPQIAEISV